MNGVKFGEKHSYTDLGLILSKKVIEPPQVQENRITIPMRDGSLDLSDSITDVPKYKDRKIQLTFSVIDPMNTWSAKISEIENILHGRKFKIIFDDDPMFYYEGKVSVNKWTSDKSLGTLEIECIVDPFKYDVDSSTVDWEWDTFDFEEGIINETGQLIVDGSQEVTLLCKKKRMFPWFITSAPMTVEFKGETYSLKEGKQKVYDIFFEEGENLLLFKGNGTVTIDYVGGSL